MKSDRQFAVLGLGRFGQSVVKTLVDNGCSVLACDSSYELVQEIADIATYAVQGDITDGDALDNMGITNFDVVVIAIGTDLESSILATMLVKEKTHAYVVAKASSQMQKKVLEKVGADRVVLPEWEMGARLAMNLITTNVLDFINLSPDFGIAEIEAAAEWQGLTLQKAGIRSAYGLNVVAIKRGKRVLVSPRAGETLQPEDILVVIGETSDLQRFTKRKLQER